MNIDFERERAWWDAKAESEETDRADEAVNRALRWREIERRLQGVETILDVGGGTGVFSIPLARRGYRLTHLDLSPAMLGIAREKAAGVANIHFVEGNSADLSAFADRSFDLVLSLDGAISFAGPLARKALLECCRVTGRTLIVTVSNRARLSAVWLDASLGVYGRIVPAVAAMLERGEWSQDGYPENPALSCGATQDYLGPIHAFLPGELRELLEKEGGLQVIRCGGIGSLAALIRLEVLQKALADEAVFQELLDLNERFDQELMPNGPGSNQRAGLIAVAHRRVVNQ